MKNVEGLTKDTETFIHYQIPIFQKKKSTFLIHRCLHQRQNLYCSEMHIEWHLPRFQITNFVTDDFYPSSWRTLIEG